MITQTYSKILLVLIIQAMLSGSVNGQCAYMCARLAAWEKGEGGRDCSEGVEVTPEIYKLIPECAACLL